MKQILKHSCLRCLESKGLAMVAVLVALLSTAGCSSTYDCANPDVTTALVEEVAIHAKKPEWMGAIRRNTTVGGVTTLDVDKELNHYLCSTTLTYRDKDRSVDSVAITYGVKPVEGGDQKFELLWETVDSMLGEIDPIKNMTGKIVDPWYRAEKNEQQRKTLAQVAEIEKIATQQAIEHARANPPIPLQRDELLQFSNSPEAEQEYSGLFAADRVKEVFGDLNGDGHDDLAAIHRYENGYILWIFVQFAEKYGQKFTVGAFSPAVLASFSDMEVLAGKVVVHFPDEASREFEASAFKNVEKLPEFDKSRQLDIREALMKERGVEWNGVVQTY